ncbi:hypothetical protein GUITHDRAFT_145018 [Guillardia theta CCMP2712]|uniref:Uncharacterized protein n=2 Tax=Guillardia theta TaxID=55529 RepID=L1IMZ0_GUITC|nr:hypothetical protein GUITHDRAFT_145018 [Guillardia theta CCMP2712]EKX37462.1 hypothetical protein GUITHDRAFT_145018 [Guillardia theta CCMP2712]|eukprot:XP_005824442.1 hypothetical protein GUITHDRAFT_145018 [Guillardia theta CCMP2712]
MGSSSIKGLLAVCLVSTMAPCTRGFHGFSSSGAGHLLSLSGPQAKQCSTGAKKLVCRVATKPHADEFNYQQSPDQAGVSFVQSIQGEVKSTKRETAVIDNRGNMGIRCRSRRAVGHEIRRRSSIGANAIVQEPILQSVVAQIHNTAIAALECPSKHHDLDFSYSEINRVRDEVATFYNEGQRTMVQLAHLITAVLSEEKFECRSTVTAKSDDGLEFKLTEIVPLSTLTKGAVSMELAENQIDGLAVNSEGAWKPVKVVNHAVEFDALERNNYGLHRVMMHAKPSNELWKQIADSIFEVEDPEARASDDLFDNMYHIRLLVETPEKVEMLHRRIRTLCFRDSELRSLALPVSDKTRQLELISQVDSHHISAVMWKGTGIAIQVQSLDEFYRETELTTMAARSLKEAKREEFFQMLEKSTPVYRFSRDMLHWMLASKAFSAPPSCEFISVNIHP